MSWNKWWYVCLGLTAGALLAVLACVPSGAHVAYGQTAQPFPTNPCAPVPGNLAGDTGAGANYPEVSPTTAGTVGTVGGCTCNTAAISSALNNYILNNPGNYQGLSSVLNAASTNECPIESGVIGNTAVMAFLSTGGTNGAGLDPNEAAALVAGLNGDGVADSAILADIQNSGGAAALNSFVGLFPCSDPIWSAAASYGLVCTASNPS
jgi:hypothetical protein